LSRIWLENHFSNRYIL